MLSSPSKVGGIEKLPSLIIRIGHDDITVYFYIGFTLLLFNSKSVSSYIRYFGAFRRAKILDPLYMVLYVIAGFISGFLGALIGLGGGFILVPILTIMFGHSIFFAKGTSLFMIIFTSISSSIEYLRKRLVDMVLGLIMAPFTIMGVIIGTRVSLGIPEKILTAIFGIALIIVSIRLFLKKDIKEPNNSEKRAKGFKFLGFSRAFEAPDGKIFHYYISIPFIAIFGFFVGFCAGLLGVGGGFIQVPIFTLLFGVPIHVAVATSMFIIIFTSTFGAITHYLEGYVMLDIGILLIIGTIGGGITGAKTAQRIPRVTLRKLFAIIMVITGFRMIFAYFLP